ncbi:nitrilase family protein [Flavobacterium agricola]|uniref:Nitrilase family protein n=1 Tax=Flavobacterium agricola TaxID=2870839 RepID=A0ABY6LZ76_9FLAO|nr:nitrilase-related carbon-nitrogen hydrolase [Flavobacterium agricola]UYW00852.1 nitrilase family protein [Flavobacterium agricola]
MLKVALVQAPLVWENIVANANYFYSVLETVDADLVVLPEMFTTGFTMNPATNYETMDGAVLQKLQAIALQKNFAITGSLIIKENNQFYNRLVFIAPNNPVQHYDKRHLFSLVKEQDVFTAGKNRLLVEYKEWKICPLVCYDLRFPAFARNNVNYDLLLYVASWPEKRIYAWDSLLKARAIENMTYTIGVNRIGIDGYNANYVGHSQVVDYMGEYLVAPFNHEAVVYTTLHKEPKDKAIAKLGFLYDQDIFSLES